MSAITKFSTKSSGGTLLIPAILLILLSSSASAQQIDCGKIQSPESQKTCDIGYCPNGRCVLMQSPAITHLSYYCACVPEQTTTTMPPYCSMNYKTQTCEGYCEKGLACVEYYGKCACLRPTTTTTTTTPRRTTTSTTLRQLISVGDILAMMTTTSTLRRLPAIPHVTIPINTLPDMDHDGVPDVTDNCINVSNTNQMDLDIDGVGDACDRCQCISCTEAVMSDYMYDFNDRNGCGCDDSDGGKNIFVKGTIDRAQPPGGDSVETPSAGVGGGAGIALSPAALSEIGDKVKIPGAELPSIPVSSTPSDYNPKHYTDFCKNSKTLVEYYCDREGLHSMQVNCTGECVDGHCRCNEIGDGNNKYVADSQTADYCSSPNLLSEGYYYGNATSNQCTLKRQSYLCIAGCTGSPGRCVCGDTDGGINANVRGTTSALNRTDYCIGANRIREYYISSTSPCTDSFQDLNCQTGYACYAGQCKPASCLDGIQNGDETGVDCGGTWCPPCSPCVTGAKWAPTDGPCRHKWPTSDGPGIGMNTGSDSCNLVEVCDNNLDFIVADALKCCENADYGSVLTAPRKASKEESCNWARTVSGLGAAYTQQNFKKCTGLYTISAFGYSAIYMQGYFHGEWCCYDSDSLCHAGCEHFKVRPTAWQMGTTSSCAGDGGAHPDFNMGGHRCEYYEFIVKWGKAGYWSSDTDYHSNSDSVVDAPAHASINLLSTGTCVDYSFALTTMLRKLGYSKDDVFSVNGEGHGYNLLRFPGDVKFHYVDTVGNRGNEVLGGAGFIPIVNQSAAGKPKLAWYDYCRKLDDGCSNDEYSQSVGRCPSNDQIFGCEGVPR